MTGELCDAFATREEGAAAGRSWSGCPAPARAFLRRPGFAATAEAADHAIEIASANWHASAVPTGTRKSAALFIDMGSTTTDLIPVADGRGRKLRPHRRGGSLMGNLSIQVFASFPMAGPSSYLCRPMDAPDE
jgi:uncharacterized hydantoinase/oxoprolinase family protein